MRLLLIDTCGTEGVVALAEDSALVAVETLPGRAASEQLVPAVRRLMEQRDDTDASLQGDSTGQRQHDPKIERHSSSYVSLLKIPRQPS